MINQRLAKPLLIFVAVLAVSVLILQSSELGFFIGVSDFEDNLSPSAWKALSLDVPGEIENVEVPGDQMRFLKSTGAVEHERAAVESRNLGLIFLYTKYGPEYADNMKFLAQDTSMQAISMLVLLDPEVKNSGEFLQGYLSEQSLVTGYSNLEKKDLGVRIVSIVDGLENYVSLCIFSEKNTDANELCARIYDSLRYNE